MNFNVQRSFLVIRPRWVDERTWLFIHILIIKIYFDRSFVQFLCEFLRFEVVLTSEDILRGCHDVSKGQGQIWSGHSQKVKM